MKSRYFLLLLSGILIHCLHQSNAQSYILNSPGGKAEFQISFGNSIEYSVLYNRNLVIEHSTFNLQFSQAPVFGKDLKVIKVEEKMVNEKWQPVAGNYQEVVNHYNEMVFNIREKKFPERTILFAVRAYDDGIAFRYNVPESWSRFLPNYEQNTRLILVKETTDFHFTSDHLAWAADYGAYDTHQEASFDPIFLSEIQGDQVIGLPFLAKVSNACYAAITEARLTDWAGMYLKKARLDQPFTLTSDLSPLPDNPAGKVMVLPGSWSPWRVIMLGDRPGALIESEIISNLNDPCEIKNPSWIKPGISAWDHWWSGEVKMDTKTLEAYIQLAADMGWEYMLIDWHWYGAPFTTDGEFWADPNADITTVNPAVNMTEVREFAKEKNVKLILWLLWEHVDKQMDEAFALYESWGIAGVKIDFMARDDQEMVNWYHKVVKKAAEYKLVVDFHGAYKPTGWSRTYPNLLTREGVLGNEYSKWSSRVTPEHNVTLPFTRMLAGPMDYTPGGFLNVTAENFRAGAPAQVMSTRAHQLAMFVVYFSPYTVACDHPDNYKNQPGIEFLKEVPTTWDDTRVLSGEVGDHIIMARKKGNRWYIGGMNNSEPKNITIHLDFLPEEKYTMNYFKDSPESNIDPTKILTGKTDLSGGEYYPIKMEKGGGFAGYVEPK